MLKLEPYGRHPRLNKSWRKANRALRRYPPHLQTVLIEHWRATGATDDPKRFMAVVHHFESMQASRRPIGAS